MGWLNRKLDKWASDSQRKEMADFIDRLRTMDGTDLGLVVAMATTFRHQLEAKGHNPMDPILYTRQNPDFCYLLSSTAVTFQKEGKPQDAAALMVWVHTARAGLRLELRSLGRELWKQLERGFPYVEETALPFRIITGTELNIEGATDFPIGLTPEPL
mgnify:CR=1 FL=1